MGCPNRRQVKSPELGPQASTSASNITRNSKPGWRLKQQMSDVLIALMVNGASFYLWPLYCPRVATTIRATCSQKQTKQYHLPPLNYLSLNTQKLLSSLPYMISYYLQIQVSFRPDRKHQEHSKAPVPDTTIGFSGPTFPGSAARVRVPERGNSWGSG